MLIPSCGIIAEKKICVKVAEYRIFCVKIVRAIRFKPRDKSNSNFQFSLKLKTNNCVERVGHVRVFKIDLNQELQMGRCSSQLDKWKSIKGMNGLMFYLTLVIVIC